MRHLDLFSGIGGFSLAVDRVWYDEKIEHTFVEYDPFCQEVLKKHWPKAEIHGDIRQFVTDTKYARLERWPRDGKKHKREAREDIEYDRDEVRGETGCVHRSVFILTGGFPCQPFSQAGRRKGTADDRYLWPPMLECIALYRPEWVIAENVAGLATWDNGVVLETVCTDLEKEGYEVQPFIIPAVAVGAPHRRDRIWIVAHSLTTGTRCENRAIADERRQSGKSGRASIRQIHGQTGAGWINPADRNAPDTKGKFGDTSRLSVRKEQKDPRLGKSNENENGTFSWNLNWPEVATALCGVDDGLPRRLDRNPRLKALGNAIVPAVAEEIMRAMRDVYSNKINI